MSLQATDGDNGGAPDPLDNSSRDGDSPTARTPARRRASLGGGEVVDPQSASESPTVRRRASMGDVGTAGLARRGSIGGESAALGFAKNLAAFRTSLNETMPERLEAMLRVMLPPLTEEQLHELDGDAKEAHEAKSNELSMSIKSVLDGMGRSIIEYAEALSEADISEDRKALKTQKNMMELKMEASRTAATVQLQNVEAEQAAATTRALQQQAEKLTSGGDEALKNAIAAQEELVTKLEKSDKKCNTLEETLRATKVELGAKTQEAATSATMLEEATAEAAKATEKYTAEIESLQQETMELREALGEAAAEAQRAAEASEAECKRQVEAMAARLQEEVDNAVRGEREKSESRFQRLYAELKSMAKTINSLEAELAEQIIATKQEEFAHKKSLKEAAEAAERAADEAAAECKRQVEAKEAQLREEFDAAMKAEREAFEARIEKLETTMSEEREANKAQVAGLEADISQLRDRIAAQDAQIAEMKIAAEEAIQTKEALVELQKQEAECRQQLGEALAALEIAMDEKKTLTENLGTLIEQHKIAQQDVKNLKGGLEEALESLGIKVDENNTLTMQLEALLKAQAEEAERQKQLMSGALDASAEIDRLQKENLRMTKELNTATQDATSLRSGLEEALTSLGIKVEQNVSLKEQVESLASKCERVKLELTSLKSGLEEALASLGIRVEENVSLKEHVEALSRECGKVKLELASLKSGLEEALASLGIKVEENVSLKEHVEAITSEAIRREAEYTAQVTRMQSEFAAAVKKHAREMEFLVDEYLALKAKAATLAEDLGNERHANQHLTESLDSTLAELTRVETAMRAQATTAGNERANLVLSALASLQHLRESFAAVLKQSGAATLEKSLDEVMRRLSYIGLPPPQPVRDQNPQRLAPPAESEPHETSPASLRPPLMPSAPKSAKSSPRKAKPLKWHVVPTSLSLASQSKATNGLFISHGVVTGLRDASWSDALPALQQASTQSARISTPRPSAATSELPRRNFPGSLPSVPMAPSSPLARRLRSVSNDM